MTEEKCIACDKVLGDNPVFWDVSGGYWCESCGFKEMIDDLRSKLDRTELAEVKARMEIERLREAFDRKSKVHDALNSDYVKLRDENNRLRGVIWKISDDYDLSIIKTDKYLAGDSDAI